MSTYPAATFPNTRNAYDAAVTALGGEKACSLEHGEIELLAQAHGREFIRSLIQDHCDLRSERDRATVEPMRGADGVERTEVRNIEAYMVAVNHFG